MFSYGHSIEAGDDLIRRRVRYGWFKAGRRLGDSIFGIVGLQVGARGEHPTLHTSTDSQEFLGPTTDPDGARPK